MSEHYEKSHGSSDQREHRDHHGHHAAEQAPTAHDKADHVQQHATAASHKQDPLQTAAGHRPTAENVVQQPGPEPQYGPQPVYAGAVPLPPGVAPAAHYPGAAPAYPPHPMDYAAAPQPQPQPQPVMMPGIPGPAYHPGHAPGQYGHYFAYPHAPAYPPSAYPYPGPGDYAHAGHPHGSHHHPGHVHGGHHHAGYAAHPGAPAGMSELVEEIRNGGDGLSSLSRMLNLDDQEFWKGAVIGAAAVLLLTNDTVQKTLLRTSVKAKDTIQDGVDKIKQTARTQKEKFQSKTQDGDAGDEQ